jgi:6-phosphogluconolactonase
MPIVREVLETPEALAQRAAELVTSILERSTGDVAVALSGGSTPKRLYEILAAEPFRSRLPWQRVHLFWGDERFVPPDDPDSNYRMTRLAMLDHVSVPADHVHPVPTTGTTPQAAADRFQQSLRDFYGADALVPDKKLFKIVLLGMGDDGHTASLFPGVAALEERVRWTAAIIGAKPEPRISLTLPALDSAEHVIFLVTGAKKRDALARLAAGENLPAGRVRTDGTIHWLLDREAAETA